MIRLGRSDLDIIRDHAGRTYPHECCGALLGATAGAETGNGGSARRVLRVVAIDNGREDERERRYLIGPEDVLAVERRAAEAGIEVVGFYHSHPDHPAVPSTFDREHAWPWYAYVIVPVAAGVPGAARAWRLAEDRERFIEQPIDIEMEETS